MKRKLHAKPATSVLSLENKMNQDKIGKLGLACILHYGGKKKDKVIDWCFLCEFCIAKNQPQCSFLGTKENWI